ncbi:MAG: hypothetical protein JW726_18435 [Anaerolineales bacterium]|nr:hypothetical protein [Anaerolineales bacterium]
MGQELSGKTFNFHPTRPRSNPYRILGLIGLLLGAIWLLMQVRSGTVQSPFMPTPTPTRMPQSYILEAQTYFDAGKLDDPFSENDAVGAYRRALQVDPANAIVWAELARIQTYASSLTSTDQQRYQSLQDAQQSIQRGLELAPDDSTVLAVKALVFDWSASSNLITNEQREDYLTQAEAAANRAFLLDPENFLALAYYAEVLLDQQKLDQALQYSEEAIQRAPDSMDAHRVYATVLESIGLYNDAILEYKRAAEITPNLTFLYLRIGLIYRHLKVYETALEYFAQAAEINKQLGVNDPLPYIAIAKTYAQQGEFFIASRNAERALSFDPANSDTYGQLGMIYVQARNYESALPALRCAVEGCSAEENETALLFVQEGVLEESVAVEPLPLTNLTVAYYYVRYGSVLGYLHDPGSGYCERSLELMSELRQTFPDDPLLLQNIEDNEATCNSLLGDSSP